ncbi:MAG: hypothetical protein KIT83_10385 [Bryobacterales bacterium]|nr:hypothetical protein [Bryobacterales bacterium]
MMRGNSKHFQWRTLGFLSRVSSFFWRWSYQRHARLEELATVQVWQRR